MTEMVRTYMKEIEDLKAKLVESENMCTQVRKKSSIFSPRRPSFSSNRHVAISGGYDVGLADQNSNVEDLIQEAKRGLEKDRKLIDAKKRLPSTCESEENELNGEKNDSLETSIIEDDENSTGSDSENKGK